MALPPVALQKERERIVQHLCEAFAADHFDSDELERRLDRAHAAASVPELRELVSDLPAPGTPAAAPASAGPARTLAAPQGTQTVIAIMGGATRKGTWTPPRQLQVFAVMGGAELDFREAVLGPGVIEVRVFAMMGGVEIIVPPGVRVENQGIAIMGGFEHKAHGPPPGPDAPVLRVSGFVMMGGVDVAVRYPGERASDARRRERLEKKEARRLARGE